MYASETGNAGAASIQAGVMETMEGLKTAFDALQANVLVADPELRVAYANPRAIATLRTIAGEIQKNFGVRVEEILGA